MIEEISDKNQKAAVCEQVLRSLPDWFGIEEATLGYISGVKDKPMFVFLQDGEVLASYQ